MSQAIEKQDMTNLNFDAVKQDYERDGFVVLPAYLGDSELAALRDHAFPLASTLMAKKEGGTGFRNHLKTLHKHDEWFEKQLRDGRHLSLIRHLLNGDVFGAAAAWFDRPQGETEGLEPHVDALGRDKEPDAGATIWFALDPANVGNGCVHYLPGSHKNDYPDGIPIPGIDTQSVDAIAAELDPGDVVIHNALTVHWSGGNTSGLPRRAVSYFYYGARAYSALQKHKEAYR